MKKEIIVVGGGISGISFAHYCAINGYQVKLYEKRQLGGCFDSITLDNNYFFELGGHTLTYKYKTLLEILEYYGKLDQLKAVPNLKFEGYKNGMFQTLLKNINFGSLLLSLPRMFLVSKRDKSISSYYSSIFGGKNYKQLFHYLFRAILCQNPDQFPAELLFKERKADKKFPKKFVLKNGLQQFMDIVKENPNIQCYEGTKVSAVTFYQGMYQIWNDKELLGSSLNICFSCPSEITSQLLVNTVPKLAQKLQRLKLAQIDTMLVGFSDQTALRKRKKSILSLNDVFYSAIFHEVSGEKYWVFHFKGEKYTKEEKIQAIANVFDVEAQQVKLLEERRSELPIMTLEDQAVLTEIEMDIAKTGLFIASNYMEGLAIEDCCIRAKKEAHRLLTIDNNELR